MGADADESRPCVSEAARLRLGREVLSARAGVCRQARGRLRRPRLCGAPERHAHATFLFFSFAAAVTVAAAVLLMIGQLDVAVERYHQALALRPDDPFCNEMLGRALEDERMLSLRR
jgi:hypothetical protein